MSETTYIDSSVVAPDSASDDLHFRIPDKSGHLKITGVARHEEGKKPDVIELEVNKAGKAIVSIKDMNQILFALSDREDQMKLTPLTQQPVHWRKTMLGVTATKDVKKGERLNFPIEISFPCTNMREIMGAKVFDAAVASEQRKDKWTPTGFMPTLKKS